MNKKYIVNKFGGAIMSSRDSIYKAEFHIREQLDNGYNPIVVVSAFVGVTDKLEKVIRDIEDCIERSENCERLIEDFSDDLLQKVQNIAKFDVKYPEDVLMCVNNSLDELFEKLKKDLVVASEYGMDKIFHGKIMSYGEKISSLYFSEFLRSNDVYNKVFTGGEFGIVTDNNYVDANIIFDISRDKILDNIKEIKGDLIPIITGFDALTMDGKVSVLGRGGSDTTATFLASAIDAHKVILWKDVKGVLSANPSIVRNVKTVESISYKQAEESGKVVCQKAMKYVVSSGAQCEVNYIYDKSKRTVIQEFDDGNEGLKILNTRENMILMRFKDESVVEYGFLNRITKIFKDEKINLILIRNTRDVIYVTFEKPYMRKLEKIIENIKQKSISVSIENVDMIVAVGNFTWEDVNVFNKVLSSSGLDVLLGAFPYEDNVRLEAVVKSGKKSEFIDLVNIVHDKFMGS